MISNDREYLLTPFVEKPYVGIFVNFLLFEEFSKDI